MDFISSPIVTITLNIIASFLIARGVLDQSARTQFIQTTNDVIAGGVTVIVGCYSIYKIVDLHKHKLSLQAQFGDAPQEVTQGEDTGSSLPPSPFQ